jgi:aryl-phospho-beta-D-glucosidase BglC (GH1 family)
MNAGALYEEMILKSIANTFGKYYGAPEVIITIDNQPYSSGHTKMEEGQSITVDFDNAVEIK